MIVGLSACNKNESGNVGDQLVTEATKRIIEDVHGPQEFDIYFAREDLTSRLDRINRADAIVLMGFEIAQEATRPVSYRIAEDLDAVEPPVVPIGSKYSFFPGDEAALARQTLGSKTRAFLDFLVQNCPDGAIPVRSEWVGRVLERNGYRTVLTGDCGWYDPESDTEVHRPRSIEQLVFTTPHFRMNTGQAKRMLDALDRRFAGADRILSMHAAPTPDDRTLIEYARNQGWEIEYASHDTENLAFYRDSDLHVGYRVHGHLAHLRWGKPSVLLGEDSRGQGLNETLGTCGVPAFRSRSPSGVGGLARVAAQSKPLKAVNLLLHEGGFGDRVPDYHRLAAPPDPQAPAKVMAFVEDQLANGWPALTRVQETFEETYEEGMKPFVEAALE